MDKEQLKEIYDEYKPIADFYVEMNDMSVLSPLRYNFSKFMYSYDRAEHDEQLRLAHRKLFYGLKALKLFEDEQEIIDDIDNDMKKIEGEK